jgi:antitoxin YefM
MISEDDYKDLETIHLLHSPANAARLLEAIDDANSGALIEHDLIDPQ